MYSNEYMRARKKFYLTKEKYIFEKVRTENGVQIFKELLTGIEMEYVDLVIGNSYSFDFQKKYVAGLELFSEYYPNEKIISASSLLLRQNHINCQTPKRTLLKS